MIWQNKLHFDIGNSLCVKLYWSYVQDDIIILPQNYQGEDEFEKKNNLVTAMVYIDDLI